MGWQRGNALSMKRPCQEAWPVEKIMAYIQADADTHLDPELVVVFTRIGPEFLDIQRRWPDADSQQENTI